MLSRKNGRFPAGLSIMALAVAAALPGLARAADDASPMQDATAVTQDSNGKQSTAPVTQFSGVTVSRKRTQTSAAVATKQTQDRVMDTVTKEQIEALPDATATDAVKRVVGVSVNFNSDNVNGRDEAQFITIRGLNSNYNAYSFDGAPMASTDQTSRGVRTNMLPSSLVKQIDVYKTWQPDQDPNAIGGSINIITRSAFDNGGKPYFSTTDALGHNDGSGKVFSGAQGLARKSDSVFSTTFGPTQSLGLTIATNYDKENMKSIGTMTSDTVFYNYYNPNGSIANSATSGGPNTGNGVPVPQQFKDWMFNKNIERSGVDAKLEAKFSPDVYGFVEFGYNNENIHQTRIENIVDDARDTGNNPVSNQTGTSGQFGLGAAEAGVLQNKVDRTLSSVQSGLDWKLGDNQKLSFRGSFSDASQTAPQTLIKYIYANMKYSATGSTPTLSGNPGLGIRYNTSGFIPAFSVNPANYTNLANWNADYWQTDTQTIEDRVGNLQLDYRKNMDADSRGLGYAVGVDFRQLGHSYNATTNEYVPTAGGLTLAGVGSLSGTFIPGSNGLPFVVIDPGQALAQAQAAGKLVSAYSGNLANSLQSNYTHSEQNYAGYAMTTYRTDRLTAMVGLRQDNTNLSTTGNVLNTIGGNSTWSSVTNSSHYAFTLPAASLIFNATESVRLKAAFSQTIGRPTYDDYAPNTSVVENTDGSVTVTQGNPGIKPRQSNNFDLSTEWYLPNSGLASVAAFDKQIKNEIYTLSSQGQMFYDGALRNAAITQPLNSSQSRLKGIELNFVQGNLGWITPYLDGLGFSANLTVLSGRLNAVTSSGGTRTINDLVNQPNQIRNLTAFYNHNRYGVSIAYNWIGQNLRTVDSSLASQDVYWQARKELDLQAHYDITKNWKAFFEAANLTNSPVVSVTGANRSLLKDSFSLGRVFWLGLTYTTARL